MIAKSRPLHDYGVSNSTAQFNKIVNQQLSPLTKPLPRNRLTLVICAINSAEASQGTRSVQLDIPHLGQDDFWTISTTGPGSA